ncbi:hypothetical protein K431DRAFT_105060 [Polychaeton citri CBS 116435]|uniref:Uncharacterized protein n=1 Tax=Polychaeton citri CBS 116435 TaxID=1314669 RepID=A0A9P4Q879_9PEZI|nr:hypothetical protein K431DRAFT_105060 [Polychaeton citri CBS 116435]
MRYPGNIREATVWRDGRDTRHVLGRSINPHSHSLTSARIKHTQTTQTTATRSGARAHTRRETPSLFERASRNPRGLLIKPLLYDSCTLQTTSSPVLRLHLHLSAGLPRSPAIKPPSDWRHALPILLYETTLRCGRRVGWPPRHGPLDHRTRLYRSLFARWSCFPTSSPTLFLSLRPLLQHRVPACSTLRCLLHTGPVFDGPACFLNHPGLMQLECSRTAIEGVSGSSQSLLLLLSFPQNPLQ